jgi:hypothetical protein
MALPAQKPAAGQAAETTPEPHDAKWGGTPGGK